MFFFFFGRINFIFLHITGKLLELTFKGSSCDILPPISKLFIVIYFSQIILKKTFWVVFQ